MKERLKVLPLLFTFLLNAVVYWGARALTEGRFHYNIESAWDEKIPFLPQFILIYFGCYIFWVINYCIIAKQEKEICYRFFTADFYARLICFACFLLLPTTNTRPVLTGNDIWTQMVRFLYATDAPDNLLPSIHCMASWFCCIGLRRIKTIPKWYKGVSYVITVGVFLSTVFLKQHVVIDIIAGAALAEITYDISWRTNGYRVYMRVFERIGGRLTRWVRRRVDAE